MSVAWVQTVPEWDANGAPATSSAFTPTALNALIAFVLDGTSGSETLTFSGTGSGTWNQFTPPGNVGDPNSNTFGAGANLSCGGGSQTITVGPSLPFGWALEYSGVGSASASGVSRVAPGTTISGTAVSVPVGSVLVAWCVNTSTVGAINLSASPSGTNRALGTTTIFGISYCITEYAGTGASITSTFTTSIGGDTFDVIQILLTASIAAAVVSSLNIFNLGPG